MVADAVEIPSAPRTAIPGGKRGMADSPIQVFEDVFTPELIQALRREAPILDEMARRNLDTSKLKVHDILDADGA